MTIKKFIPTTPHLFTYAVILILVLPGLVQHGMFMDGTQYACVARDAALGKGSFWFPHLSDSWNKNGENAFLEHMPLSYFLESKFFLVFGESIYTEKIYCFACLLLSGFFITRTWKLLPFENNMCRRDTWLPILMWFTCGSVFWAYQNNMLEITVTIFVTASAYYFLKAVHNKRWHLLYICLSGLSIFLASLSKGLPGLFPIAAPCLFYLACRNITLIRSLVYSVILLLIPAVTYTLLYKFNPGAHKSIQFYLNERLFHRIKNDPLVDNRLTVLFWLLTDIILPLALAVALLVLFRARRISNEMSPNSKRLILFFALLGLAGVAPLTFTRVQRAVYFIPALPFLAIAFSLLVVNGIEDLKKSALIQQYNKQFKYAGILFLLSVITTCAFFVGQISRDEDMLTDVRKISGNVAMGSNINTTQYVYELWDLQFYLLRYHKITLWNVPNESSAYYLVEKNARINLEEKYAPVNMGLKDYVLLKRTAQP